jgi:predicted secreted protein
MRIRSLMLLAMLAAAPAALADAGRKPVYDQVELSASAEQDIANDLLVAVLYTEHEGQRQAEVAGRVNDAMAWALGIAKPAPGFKVQTLQYSTWPIYANDSTTVTGWRARQALRIEGRDAKAIGELIAGLQTRLAVESITYAVSREARKAAEDALTTSALAQFDARARQIAQALGRPGYRLVHVRVADTGQPDMPVPYRAVMMAEGVAKAAPAQIEAGEQTLSVVVSGTIQLDAAP